VIIPENIISAGIKSFLAFVTASYAADATNPKTNNVLYTLFNQDDNGNILAIDNFNYYKQSIAILTKQNTDARQIEVYHGYNQQRGGIPTIHVLLPHEGKGNQNSIGDSVGSPSITYNSVTQEVTITKEKSFSPTYSIMITSSNQNEILLIYYFLRAMFIMFDEHFELNGLRNVTFSGADISFQPELPPGIFHRNLSISFDYMIDIQVSFPSSINQGFIINATVCED